MENSPPQLSKDYYRIEKAICFLGENFQDQPDLHKMAETAGMSEFHFQRIFRRWAGISPKRFLQFLTKEYAKELLKSSPLLDVSYEAGLSGPGRLHDLFINCEAMSPGEYKQQGQGLTIDYGFHPSPFGECFIASTERGICSLQFLDKNGRRKVLEGFLGNWKNAECIPSQDKTGDLAERIFFPGRTKRKKGRVHVLFKGTNFQIKVWEALLRIPPGKVVTYQTLAETIEHPRAVRAVGNAVGRNPIAYLIPCHRVIRSAGYLGGYRWGIARKRAMLGIEAAHEVTVNSMEH